MDYLLLFFAIFTLLFSLRRLSKGKFTEEGSFMIEAKENARSLLWGVPIISAMIFIPYQTWVLTGSSHYWDGVYIIGGAALLTITLSFGFYYKSATKLD